MANKKQYQSSGMHNLYPIVIENVSRDMNGTQYHFSEGLGNKQMIIIRAVIITTIIIIIIFIHRTYCGYGRKSLTTMEKKKNQRTITKQKIK